MTANSINRGVPQAALVSLLQAAMVGTGKPVQAIVGYSEEYDKTRETPYMTVAENGTSSRASGIANAKWDNVFCFEVVAFFRNIDEENGWTRELLRDQINLVDKELRDTIADNRSNPNWSFIDFAEQPGQQPSLSQIITDPSRGCVMEIRNIYVRYIEA